MRLTLALLLIALNWTSSVVLAEDPEGHERIKCDRPTHPEDPPLSGHHPRQRT